MAVVDKFITAAALTTTDSYSAVSWSGGKDSAWALYQLVLQGKEPQRLITTISAAQQRITMHGVRRSLLEAQANALGLPVVIIELPAGPSMSAYEEVMNKVYQQLKTDGFEIIIFGDIFLEDLKQYREQTLARHNLQTHFPLWGKDSLALIHDFMNAGFKAIVIAVDGSKLDASFCGRLIDTSFLQDLPADVDPCGENGEYHSFVFDGPLFQQPVSFSLGERVTNNYPAPKTGATPFNQASPETIPFHFIDLMSNENTGNVAADY